MAEEKQNPLAIIALIALIGLAGFFITKRAVKSNEEMLSMVYWVSDTSDYEVEAPKSADPAKMVDPSDNSPLFIGMKLQCKECDTIFEAYRMTPSAGVPGVKVKGDARFQEYGTAMSKDKRISSPKCPNCGASKTKEWNFVYPERRPISEVEQYLPDYSEMPEPAAE
ncbi:MAG: hypothetical protein PHF14_02320 [Verrucomicrobiota bacterium]|jgi:hypothetical protein|nr:hypothetical protein [Verrucomicrobiota bacterium]MDD8045279.1 hypothetical protein [Verrucomicrobiota bacterium]MDD8051456.1 hypothetical protein [Verrucomicrobiota bacterium]MDI9384235.1 hypothetical protein [Verrucomicrobiota bacterium]